MNPFQHFWHLGFKTVIPVIPASGPAAGYAAKSDNYLGKAPGFFDDAIGMWRGFTGWQNYQAAEADLVRWHDTGANVGLRLGDELLAVDIDAGYGPTAETVEKMTVAALGPSPCRIGRAPRRMLLYRLSSPMRYKAIVFDENGENEKIEFATGKRQMVIYGTHAKTKRPYEWTRLPIPFEELAVVSPHQVETLIHSLRAVLPPSTIADEGSGADRSRVDQQALRGPRDYVVSAIQALPNNHNTHPTRDDYIQVGAAIKAALEDENEAFELWCEWAAKYDDGGQSALWGKDWRGLKPPFAIGANYLFGQAEKLGGWPHKEEAMIAMYGDQLGFEAVQKLEAEKAAAQKEPGLDWPDEPKDFEETEAKSPFFEVLTIDQLFNRPDPVFLLDRHIPEKSVGFLYGDPGTGKSFIALDWALTIAFEKPDWFGDAVNHKENGCVIYIAGEGASGFKSRVAAWQHRRGVTADQKGRFGLIHQSVDFMSDEDMKRLLATIRKVVRSPVSMIVVDTVSRALPGTDENLQKEMSLFVKTCDVVRDAFDCAVLGVHHAGKNGDMRGSTVLRGAGDFIFKLERKRGASIGRLVCEKQKDAPDGWSDAYRFDVVTIGPDKSSLVPERCEDGSTGEGALLTPSASRSVLEAMRDAWMAGEPWGRSHQSGDRWAVRRMVQDFHFAADQAENVLAVWLGSGAIVEDMASKKSKRKGLRVVDITSAATLEEEGETPVSVFD